jgi:hypothetical protein
MHSVTTGVNDRYSGSGEHSRHDRVLVSRFGAGDAYPAEQDEARQLVARCAECARLAADIEALRSAAAALPAPVRTRDFRLTAEQAEQLRGGAFQRWLRRLAAPGLAPVRPLAGVALSIGLVLVVAGAALPSPAGDLASIEVFGDGDTRGMPAQPPTDNVAPEASPMLQPDAPGAPGASGAPGATPEGAGGEQQPDLTDDLRQVDLDAEYQQAESTRQLLITSGLVIGLISLGVLLVIVFARRRAADPLLR